MGLLVLASWAALGADISGHGEDGLKGLSYTNARIASVPWSIHLVELDRSNNVFEVQSVHAGGKAIGLETLSEQLSELAPELGKPVAAINGDFYERENSFAGAPRGLQIVNGEVISAPSGGVSLWIDAVYQPHVTSVISRFHITWSDGSTTPFGLNGARAPDAIEVYTPAIGASTHTTGGRELILEPVPDARRLPLRIGLVYPVRIREVHDGGNTALAPNVLVLSVGPKALGKLPPAPVGSVLRISTDSVPGLHGVRAAISGGPVLLRGGKRQKFNVSDSEAYEFSSMLERHPRTAVGWNAERIFLIEVDGRQKHLSVGMTLDELSDYLLRLGCTDAMNLDGGGSATLWYNGEVKNSPCDRMEREIANCLVVLKKRSNRGTPNAGRAR